MSGPLLFTMWYWVILLAVVVSTTRDVRMGRFRNAMRDRFPGKEINMNRLLRQYTTICPYLTECDLDHVIEPAPFVYSRSEMSIPSCRPCHCFTRCMEYGSCCPGSPYQYFRYELVNLDVYSGHYVPPSMTYMITHCPAWYNGDQRMINQCMGENSVLVPIVSGDTLFTYKNKFCAACHNETSVEHLKLIAVCFDYEKNVSGIDDILNRPGCWLSFNPPNTYLAITHFPILVPDSDGISACNVTGLWKEFDHDVNWACENMINFYQGFKNLFCYICNPSISSTQADTPLIESCNVTGNWMIYKQKVENACRSESQTQRLFPFKNIHCMICNGIDNIREETLYKVAIEEKIYPSQINITLQFNTDNSADFLKEMQSVFSELDIRLQAPLKAPLKNRVNIRNLSYVMDRYESICGMWPNCRLPEEDVLKSDVNWLCWKGYKKRSPCICSKDCAEHGLDKCCPYILFKFSPYNCVSNLSFPSWNVVNDSNATADPNLHPDTLVIDECLTDDKVDAYFSFNSSNTSTEHVLNIPVRTSSNIMYKNLSYLLCNSAKQIAYVDLRLKCNTYIEYSMFMNIVELLQTVKQFCSIHFLPLNTSPCSKPHAWTPFKFTGRYGLTLKGNLSENIKDAIVSAHAWTGRTETYSKCNQTGMWQVEQRDIRFLCEEESMNVMALERYKLNGFQYKNFACFICNPLLRADEIENVISTCNVTGAWDDRNLGISKQCNITKYQERYLPFKNFFCSECNLPHKRGYGYSPFRKTGRTLFAISENKWWQSSMEKQIERATVCFDESNYSLQEQCQEVMCSRFHILKNGSCKSLPHEPMVYALSFELNWRHDSFICFPCKQRYCDTMRFDVLVEQISYYISNIEPGDIYDDYYYSGYVDSSCDRNTQVINITASPKVIYSFTFAFHLRPTVTVLAFEKKLVDFLYKEHVLNITIDNEPANICRIVFQPLPKSFHAIAKDSHLQNQTDQCYYEKYFILNSVTLSHEPLFRDDVVVVDRYLLCPQLNFSSDEYQYNNVDDTVTITRSGTTFESGYFKRQGTAVRICIKDYKEQLNRNNVVVENYLLEAYNVFSYIVIGISLISLALTFTTYCLLRSLRTLPGKNIMVLTFCLLCAQTLLLFALHLESNTLICKTMGILIHYFWLATYCAMNVCSFHLLNVFYMNSLTKASPESDIKRFSGYLVYTFGMPLLVVAATVCTYVIPSDGQAIGYGKILCFLSDINASIAAFIAPSMLVFSSNIVFFGLAFHKIRTTAKIQDSRNTERNDFFICIRICAIVGITGPLYLLDAFIGFSYFSFVVEGINSIQGLLICLSYVCNGRVLALFREKFNLK